MLDSIADVMKEAYSRGWITTRDGNASFKRINEDYLYITPSGVRKQHLNAEMMLKLKLHNIDDTLHTGLNSIERVDDDYQRKIIGLNPSGELALHYLLQKRINTNNRVVLHLHPTYIIAAMYAGIDLQKLSDNFPELSRYTSVGPTVPIIPPVSEELALASIDALNLNQTTGSIDFNIICMDRHGIIAIGKDAWEAFGHVERLEHICQIVLASGKF
jgi:ribulose-5-phosphate 4-epimerase/fuculose-1-phosphate aldolase